MTRPVDAAAQAMEMIDAVVAVDAQVTARKRASAPKADVGEASRLLRYTTAEEIYLSMPPPTPWYLYPIVAPGLATSLIAGPKGGKTTLVMSALYAMSTGADFLGHPTTKTKVLYLTEEGRSTSRANIQRAGLRVADVFILHLGDCLSLPWPILMDEVLKLALSLGVEVVVIDTLPAWARYDADGENSAGQVLAAYSVGIRPLLAAGLGVLLIGHTRKSGGDAVESQRGSSALAGAVDLIAVLRRPQSLSAPRTIRILEVVGRADGLPDEPLVVDYREGEYILADEEAAADVTDTRARLLSCLSAEARPMPASELAEKVRARKADVIKLLGDLFDAGRVQRTGSGRRGNPHTYVSVPGTAGTAGTANMPDPVSVPAGPTRRVDGGNGKGGDRKVIAPIPADAGLVDLGVEEITRDHR